METPTINYVKQEIEKVNEGKKWRKERNEKGKQ